MTAIKWIIKTGLVLVATLFFMVAIVIPFGTAKQMERDEKFKEEFTPYISYVETFKIEHDRYPSGDEFEKWEAENLSSHKADLTVGAMPYDPDNDLDITENNEYVIQIWRGEWFGFYVAEEGRFYPEDWSWGETVKGSLILIIIGVGLVVAGIKIPTRKLNRRGER